MFRILPPSGESSTIASNSHGNNTADIMRRRQPPSALRNHRVASVGEFVGTFMFHFFAFTLHMATISQLSSTESSTTGTTSTTRLVIPTICFAYAFFYAFWLLVYARNLPGVSPGMFSPAVSLGLVVAGALSDSRALVLLPVQVVAGISAAAVVKGIVPGDLSGVEAVLRPGVRVAQGLFLEMFTTSLVVIMVLVLVARTGALDFVACLGIGIALFAATLVGIGYTGASMNPVRALAPCAASGKFPDYHWLYWAGPILGALLPGIYIRLMKFLSNGDFVPSPEHGHDNNGTLPTEQFSLPGVVGGENSRMSPDPPTPPKIRKTTVTHVRSSRSLGDRRPQSGGDAYVEKDDLYESYYPSGSRSPPRSPLRNSREQRRPSVGRYGDMDRYARFGGYDDVLR